MSDDTVLVLTSDVQLLQTIQAAARGRRVVGASCLVLAHLASGTRLVIDPRSVQPCCLEGLGRLRPGLDPGRVVFLSLPAPPEVLLGLPMACPGVIGRVEDLDRLLGESVASGPGHPAWRDRARILSPEGRPARARLFLELVQAHRKEAYTVPAAADQLGLSARQLERFVLEWFGQSPWIVFALARLESVSREILRANRSIELIALEHGYPGRSALTRQFVRFVGVPPREYRARPLTAPMSRNDTPMSEFAL